MTHVVHDTTGTKVNISSGNPQGFITLSVNIPSIYQNMCGWFWDIKDDFYLGTTGEKMWVVLNNTELYCDGNPYDSVLKKIVDCKQITDIVESSYDKMEIKVEGLIIKLFKEEKGIKKYSELMWAWGEDASKIKGQSYTIPLYTLFQHYTYYNYIILYFHLSYVLNRFILYYHINRFMEKSLSEPPSSRSTSLTTSKIRCLACLVFVAFLLCI